MKDHHDAELRSLLEPLGDLANRLKITILTIKHLNKDEAKTVASRVGGSIAYVNVPRACAVIAPDPDNETRRILAWFKWNLNAEKPPSIAWTMEPAPPDRLAAILASCDHLSDEDKAKLARQLHCLKWAGKVETVADDLLRTAARIERKSFQNEVDRATEWLSQRLADGPVGSVIIAREGDKVIGRIWPAPSAGHSPDEQRKRVLGRVKWWRETILKPRLKGESARGSFNGPYFFRLPDHLTRGLWPPPSEAIRVAQHADDSEIRPDLDGNPRAMTATGSPPVAPVEAVEAVEATGRDSASTVGRTSRLIARDEQSGTVESGRGSLARKVDSTASTVHHPTEQAEIASTDSTLAGAERTDPYAVAERLAIQTENQP